MNWPGFMNFFEQDKDFTEPMIGVGSALLGKEAAMACTEAVEDVIAEHYNSQLRELVEKTPEDQELREVTIFNHFLFLRTDYSAVSRR